MTATAIPPHCVVKTAFESELSTFSNDESRCLWCNREPGPHRVLQTCQNHGLLALLRGWVNFGLAGRVTARLPICEPCVIELAGRG